MFCRYNISHLEQWLRDNRLVDCGAAQNLEPIVQASQLLQARKTDTDVDSIVEMCSKLSTSQVQMSFYYLAGLFKLCWLAGCVLRPINSEVI